MKIIEISLAERDAYQLLLYMDAVKDFVPDHLMKNIFNNLKLQIEKQLG